MPSVLLVTVGAALSERDDDNDADDAAAEGGRSSCDFCDRIEDMLAVFFSIVAGESEVGGEPAEFTAASSAGSRGRAAWGSLPLELPVERASEPSEQSTTS